jgi:alanine-glyoxylate transaminase/serine-glyoxylate transaminase/serine-pyruvate transaminase
MSAPTIGHLDPAFLAIMDQVKAMLRQLFGTQNDLTMPMSGTGSAGMETLMVNLLQPGDSVLIGVNGVFGTRMCEVARRCGAQVFPVERPWGEAFTTQDFRKVAAGRKFRALFVVHAETSTGVLQPLEGFRELADELGAFFAIDCVTSIAGLPIDLDEHGVDAAYSGTQKCLSAPPGLSPISLSVRAFEHVLARSTPVQSWYLDLSLINRYWGGERAYHHTAPINNIYGLHEACRLALAEGLPARFARHRALGAELADGLTEMGLVLPVAPEVRLPQLTVVEIPEGVDDKAVRGHLLREYGLEIGGGLGAFAGKRWRIGLMGSACTHRNVTLCLAALREALGQ